MRSGAVYLVSNRWHIMRAKLRAGNSVPGAKANRELSFRLCGPESLSRCPDRSPPAHSFQFKVLNTSRLSTPAAVESANAAMLLRNTSSRCDAASVARESLILGCSAPRRSQDQTRCSTTTRYVDPSAPVFPHPLSPSRFTARCGFTSVLMSQLFRRRCAALILAFDGRIQSI